MNARGIGVPAADDYDPLDVATRAPAPAGTAADSGIAGSRAAAPGGNNMEVGRQCCAAKELL